MEPKIDKKSIIFEVGVPEGPRGRFWKDFGPILELFWDDFSKVFGRISMLGLIVFKVLASSFWGRQWEISLCCFHPFGYDLGVVLCVVCHDLSHTYSCFDKVFASSFLGRWWEISLCCCHSLEYDLGVVLYVVCHVVLAVW